MQTMDDLDRRIVQELQDDFPLVPEPYEVVAQRIGIRVDELWARILVLLDRGIIRRIGFSIDSRAMGYSSTLAAIRVAADRVEYASKLIAEYPQITHSYLRDDDFNIWFTVIAEDQQQISRILESIRTSLKLDLEDVMDLPVKKLFKLDARFK
jgi:DNA-binding Lrp family transcriptional regulator